MILEKLTFLTCVDDTHETNMGVLDIAGNVVILLCFTLLSMVFLGVGVANIVVSATEPPYENMNNTSMGFGVALSVLGTMIIVYVAVLWVEDVPVERSFVFSASLAIICAVLVCLAIVFTGKSLFENNSSSRRLSDRLWTVQLATFCTMLGSVALTLLTWLISQIVLKTKFAKSGRDGVGSVDERG
jgi:hypothetical protein